MSLIHLFTIVLRPRVLLSHARRICLPWCLVGALVCTAASADEAELATLAEQQKFSVVQDLIEQGVNVNEAQADGMSALHWAVYHDATETARRLIEAKADVSVANRYGVTPLILACQNGNGEAVELLLAAGANPNARNVPGNETPLMTASRTGRLQPVQLLLARGAEVDAEDIRHQTALMWAAAEGHADVIKLLLAAGAKREHRLDSGFTPLFFAVREGHWKATQCLLEAGSSVDAVMETKQSTRFGYDSLRLTPLLMAVENGHFELAAQLLSAGANPNAAPAGYTALHAITWVRKPIRGDGDPSPPGSGKLSSLDLVRALVAAGANINARYERGRSELSRFTYTGATPFMLAAQSSDVSLLRLLLELGADPQLTNADGTTPLLAAAGVGWIGNGDEAAGTEEEALATVDWLLEQGADPNAVDDNGETCLHGAAYHSRAHLVRQLVAAGAHVDVWNHENRAGRTPLLIALGYMPGNFSPSAETSQAIEQAMLAAGAPIPNKSALQEHRQNWESTSNQKIPWVLRNLEYARVDEFPLLLDLYLPAKPATATVVVWIHGGAWRSGSKADVPLLDLVNAGYAVASVDYRLSTQAKFPAQVHDIKAAVRYLRFLSARYGFRKDKMVIAGGSAGGHLAALVGTTNGHPDLEGNLGGHLNESSGVQAIVDFYGPTNLMTILDQSTLHGLEVRRPALQLLLGGQPNEQPELATRASPVVHVDANDPPLLLIHGDQDPQVPLEQSRELHAQYAAAQLPVQLKVVAGAAHGGDELYSDDILQEILKFLKEYVRDQ